MAATRRPHVAALAVLGACLLFLLLQCASPAPGSTLAGSRLANGDTSLTRMSHSSITPRSIPSTRATPIALSRMKEYLGGTRRRMQTSAAHKNEQHYETDGEFPNKDVHRRRSAGLAAAVAAVSSSLMLPEKSTAADFSIEKVTETISKLSDTMGSLAQLVDPITSKFTEPISNALANPAVGDLGIFLTKTVISWGVPTAAAGVLLLLAAPKSKGADMSDLDEDGSGGFGGFNPFQKQKKEPKQYLKIERVNDKLDSFRFSLTKATDSSARRATAERNRAAFTKRYGNSLLLSRLSDTQVDKIAKADAKYQKAQARLQEQMAKITREMRSAASEAGEAEGDSSSSSSSSSSMMKKMQLKRKSKELQAKQASVLSAYNEAETEFIRKVSSQLSEDGRKEFTQLLKKADIGWQDGISGLSLAEKAAAKSQVFVLNFPGDVTASQVKSLRQEVTAIIRSANATRGDEVLLVLNTGGGTVTGYGLAAAQLVRVKAAGLKLTICVEQVAASGGYMMACCADRLISSPFAVLGSIGVITQQPNVYDRLKKEGVEFLTVTAGKYKRTLTPFKKPTEEDFDKTKEDLEAIWTLFKDFVKEQRPKLDVSLVATGETWFGKDALERNLVDELKTTDDVLLEYLDEGRDIYSVKYSEPQTSPLGQLLPSATGGGGLRALAMAWLFGDQVVGRYVNDRATSAGGLAGLDEYERMMMLKNDDLQAGARVGNEHLLVDRTSESTFFMDK